MTQKIDAAKLRRYLEQTINTAIETGLVDMCEILLKKLDAGDFDAKGD